MVKRCPIFSLLPRILFEKINVKILSEADAKTT